MSHDVDDAVRILGRVDAMLDRAFDPPPATNIPGAIARAIPLGGAVRVDAYGPREDWWLAVLDRVSEDCERTIATFEPWARVDVRLARVDLGGPPLCIRIDAYDRFNAFDTLRSYALQWVRHESALRLDPLSTPAFQEAWRSLYSPDVEDDRPRCIEHDDCREHPELGRACWEETRRR